LSAGTFAGRMCCSGHTSAAGPYARPPGFRAGSLVTMSEVEYLVDFTVHSVSLEKHREIGSTEQREHDAKLQKYSARYLPYTIAKAVPLSCSTYGQLRTAVWQRKGQTFWRVWRNTSLTRGVESKAVRMEYSK
jgi:hypothetical protein